MLVTGKYFLMLSFFAFSKKKMSNKEDKVFGERPTISAFPGAIFSVPAQGSMNIKSDGQEAGIN